MGLLDAEATGNPRIHDLSRSHVVLLLELPSGRRLVVKHPRPGSGPGRRPLGREIVVYAAGAWEPRLREVMPACLALEPASELIVLGYVEPGDTVHSRQYASAALDTALAHRLGAAAATWHAVDPAAFRPSLGAELPWVLSVLETGAWRPGPLDEVLSRGDDRRSLRQTFQALREEWTATALIHADLKWDNCLIEEPPGDTPGIRVADWETATVGDPAWDLAGLLAEYVVFAALVVEGQVPETNGDGWILSGDDSARCVSALLDAYRERSAPDGDVVADRAIRFVGGRLIQTALEYSLADRSRMGLAQALVRASRRVLEDPESFCPA